MRTEDGFQRVSHSCIINFIIIQSWVHTECVGSVLEQNAKTILSYLTCSNVHCPRSMDALNSILTLVNQANGNLQDLRRNRIGSSKAWQRGCSEYVFPTAASILPFNFNFSVPFSQRQSSSILIQYDQWVRRTQSYGSTRRIVRHLLQTRFV